MNRETAPPPCVCLQAVSGTVTVVTENQTRSVSGTVFADGRPRIVNIKGIRMDAEFGPSMIYITNLDKPGFIGRFSSTLGGYFAPAAVYSLKCTNCAGGRGGCGQWGG